MKPLALFSLDEMAPPQDLPVGIQDLISGRHKLWYHKGKWWEYPFAINPREHISRAKILDIDTAKSIWPYLLRKAAPAAHIDLVDTSYQGYDYGELVTSQITGNFTYASLNAPYDLITCLSTIEHVPPENFMAFIRRIYQVLTPGGIGVFTTDLCRDNALKIDTGLKLADGNTRYVDWFVFDLDSLRGKLDAVLHNTGLELIKLHAGTVLDLDDSPAIDWDTMDEIMVKFHDRKYTSCGWVMRRKL